MATVEPSARWDQSNGLDSNPSSTQVAEGYLCTILQMDSTASDAMTFDSKCWGDTFSKNRLSVTVFHFRGSPEVLGTVFNIL